MKIVLTLTALCLSPLIGCMSTEPPQIVDVVELTQPMSRTAIEAGLQSHDRALLIKNGWIRDPYIILGPDDYYYLTGTTPNPGDPREQSEPYNDGLGEDSVVGTVVQLWRSKDLIDWDYLGVPFTLKDAYPKPYEGNPVNDNRLWAPELHWMGDRWAIVHCPAGKASFALAPKGLEVKGPWTHPMQGQFGKKHDPSLYRSCGRGADDVLGSGGRTCRRAARWDIHHSGRKPGEQPQSAGRPGHPRGRVP